MEPVIRRCGASRCPPTRACRVRTQVLCAVPSTLLIPLAARASGGQRFPWLDCDDQHAADLLHCLNADDTPRLRDGPTVVNVLWRTQLLKEAGRAFFREHPTSLGVNLGCGLSSHFQWLDTGHNRWVDADLPEVTELREELLPDGRRRKNAMIDLSEGDWWDRLGLPEHPEGAPVFILCEGVLMYLQPHQVEQVLRTFGERAPAGSRLVLDTLSYLAVGRARLHASVGPTGAEFHWGIRSPGELTAPHGRLELHSLRSVTECYGLAGVWSEAWWQPWIGSPLYGMATLGVDN